MPTPPLHNAIGHFRCAAMCSGVLGAGAVIASTGQPAFKQVHGMDASDTARATPMLTRDSMPR